LRGEWRGIAITALTERDFFLSVLTLGSAILGSVHISDVGFLDFAYFTAAKDMGTEGKPEIVLRDVANKN
jgi:hypothetical protein